MTLVTRRGKKHSSSTRRALKKSEARFQQVVEWAPNAKVMIRQDGRIEMVNGQAEVLFGYSRTELLGQPVEMLLPLRFRGSHESQRDSYFLDPHFRTMGVGRELFGLRKDGSEFPVEVGLNPIETDDGLMVLSAIVDISARKRLEERFRRVVEWAPNAMVMIRANGLIELVNSQAEAVFGYPRDEMLGQPVEMLVPERFRSRHPVLRGSFFDDPHSRPMGAGRDLYGLRKDGSEFPVEIGLNPIETDEGTMVLSSIVDISDRRIKEIKIEAALREKDILLAEVHHRVKNNLQVINSLLALQSAKIKDDATLALMIESQNRIKSMAMIHQTLYESRDFTFVDFHSFLDRIVPSLVSAYAVNPRRITLSIRADKVSLPIQAAIPCGLIVNELVANALKHAFPGDARGRIDVELDRDAEGKIVLSVSDDGVGMPDGVDLANAATLGLQLVALLADQLGGALVVNPARPTRFCVRFPEAS